MVVEEARNIDYVLRLFTRLLFLAAFFLYNISIKGHCVRVFFTRF